MFPTERRRRSPSRTDSFRARSVALETAGRTRPTPRIWAPVAVGVITAIATTIIVGFGGKPFSFRFGQRTDREIRLKVNVQIFNETKTRNEKEDAANQAPLVFEQNTAPNVQLREKILALVNAVSKQSVFDLVDPAVRSEWKLTKEQFDRLRLLVPDPAAAAVFAGKLDKVFKDILDYGVLDEAALPADQQRERRTIEVFTVGVEQPRLTLKDNVLLTQMIKTDGPLAEQLKRNWPLADDAAVIFRLFIPAVGSAARLTPTLVFDPQRSRAAAERSRQSVPEVFDEFPKGYLVVPQGDPIDEDQLRLLFREHQVLQANMTYASTFAHFAGIGLIVCALLAMTGFYLETYQREVVENGPRLASLCLLFVATIALARLLSLDPYRAEVVPIALASFLLAVAYHRPFAMIVAFSVSLLVAITLPESMNEFIVLIGGTAVGVLVLDSVRSRTKLITVGLYAGVAYLGLSAAADLFTEQPVAIIFEDAARHFASGLIAGFLISGSLPFIESTFGIVTDISLLELADTSHPLLQELIRRAPGTYNHSVSVSIIGEAAAKKIGANSLLVRVSALFHDIGKMLKPSYFIENKSANERNRHEQLAPAMSTLIIIGHVKDGADLATQHHLPQPILDMIEQHHGTTLVDYFYYEAAREMKNSPDPEETVEESSFRYPGPKPQSKEAGVLMLSDCVESASRALSEPTPARIEKLVHNLALNRLLDGQFSESGLTLEEVQQIEESLIKSLTAVYHGRIKYPAAS